MYVVRMYSTMAKSSRNAKNVLFVLKFLTNIAQLVLAKTVIWGLVFFPCRYDMISKMETLLEDAEVIQRYGFKMKNPAPFPVANIKNNQNSTEKIRKYFRSIPREHTAELKKIYKDDFALFGYDSNNLWRIYEDVYYTYRKYIFIVRQNYRIYQIMKLFENWE